ncbi:multidrug resistance protein MdtC [Afipia carboxidovorans OM5]|uniref:Multidrug resistance protein MdtC n=1 Tax=Afipia carboxidovorans (strain ATCC 49405 / DSM 1227 / KCTC 32145 / OM5) TaxID=504832 RepID=B6JI39_AFIC5|nr:efflux RND transporter permease subunit [Afipia carboxidovorans]ACI93182.1 multidrug resistance protein MdtC [Afipia carboxidovorans OM5]AEI03095.1 multidrug resistance protein MdtC [Afipia carboxidovorans OM4]AEI06672.1 multidrug resistance protein MdtC [Afipia carboxidovorans OM5]
MSISEPFIRRPVGTTLLAIGLFLVGAVAYVNLPVASIPNVDFPMIRISASRPGADPSVMAATVAAPLERRLGEIAGVDQITSSSSLGSTSIQMQFAIGRSIDKAARDVQAAINASLADLPSDLPSLPNVRKANTAATPVFIIALTSKTMSPSAIYDIADTVIAQRIAQVPGVGEVTVSGADQPAIRVQMNPMLLANAGISTEQVRAAIVGANAFGPIGMFDGGRQGETLGLNPQMRTAAELKNIVIKASNGNFIRLSDVATVIDATRSSRSIAWFNKQPAVLLQITKQSDANVIDTVDRIKDLLPQLKQWIPAGVEVSTLTDRTGTIRASVEDMQWTLGATALLVMAVVFIFLRRGVPTIAAGVSVPLALAGTCAGMWAAGFSIDNLSLMALAISIGFVVDDAIVMIENMHRNLEQGMTPARAALEGAKQIGFTVLSISLSLIAAFTPLIFMEGIVGRLLREFSLTLVFAIAVSTVVSLTVTPMICAQYIKHAHNEKENRFDRLVEGVLSRVLRFYERSLRAVLKMPILTILVFFTSIALTVVLYAKLPKGYFPTDDSGFIFGSTRASADISFQAMLPLQQRVADIVMADPAVATIGSSLGGSSFLGGSNRGTMFIALKPPEERGGVSTALVIDRLRRELGKIPGIRLFMVAAQDIRAGGRQSDSNYQYTLASADLDLLRKWGPLVAKRMETVEGITDISSDSDPGGLQLNLKIDRKMAASVGADIQDIDNALNNAFAQRQISYVYTQRNQYQIILEVAPQFQGDPASLAHIYVAGANNTQVPLSTLVHMSRGLAPLAVRHSASFPSTTISFNTLPDVPLETATENIRRAVAELHMPEGIRGTFEGNAADSQKAASRQPLLILGALVAVYIVLGVLYESLAHPLTIISTLPPAGLGALLALLVTGLPLTVIAFVGIILLIGIVKKNGIMIVDFALEGERQHGMNSEEAIFAASLARFRPIIMTTMAALLAAVPLVLATGPGTELRRPLGVTIIGGLIVSQILTLYTTPVIYLLIDRARLWIRGESRLGPGAVPAE